MANKPLNFVFIGRSGSGKGTQALLLKEFLEKRDGVGSVFYLSTGEHMRNLIKERPELKTSVFLNKKVMALGNKAPDFLTVWVWSKELIFNMKSNQHIIFDGTPRTLLEAKLLDEAFDWYEKENLRPILVDVSPEEVRIRMLARKREDDTEEQINGRLAYFEKLVAPAIEYYRSESKNKLIVVDGNPRDVNLIHKNILKACGLE